MRHVTEHRNRGMSRKRIAVSIILSCESTSKLSDLCLLGERPPPPILEIGHLIRSSTYFLAIEPSAIIVEQSDLTMDSEMYLVNIACIVKDLCNISTASPSSTSSSPPPSSTPSPSTAMLTSPPTLTIIKPFKDQLLSKCALSKP